MRLLHQYVNGNRFARASKPSHAQAWDGTEILSPAALYRMRGMRKEAQVHMPARFVRTTYR